jgi:hypothetical protein
MRWRIRRVIDQANFALFVWRRLPFAPLLNEQTILHKCHGRLCADISHKAPDGKLFEAEVESAELSTKILGEAVIGFLSVKASICR